MSTLRRASTLLLSLVIALIGVAIVVRTVLAGGGGLAVGVLVGLCFTGVGVGRLYLETRR